MRLRLLSFFFMTASLQISPGYAAWQAKMIREDRFGDVAFGSLDQGAPFALYGLTMEGVTSRSYTTFDEQGQDSRNQGTVQWENTQTAGSPGSATMEYWPNGSGFWNSVFLGHASGADGWRLAVTRCPRFPLFVEYLDGSFLGLAIHHPNNDLLAKPTSEWTPLNIKGLAVSGRRWPTGIFPRAESKDIILGVEPYGSWRVDCSNPPNWTAGPISVAGAENVSLAAYGDARGEGRPFFYGVTREDRPQIVEVEESGKQWRVSSRLPRAQNFWPSVLTIGDARGDRRIRLYAAGPRDVWEYEWDGLEFQVSRISTPDGNSLKGRSTGLVIGSFRGDGVPRLYLANGDELIEYSFIEGKWHRSRNSLGIGQLGELRVVKEPRRAPRLLVLGFDKGLYELSWKAPPQVAVTPFLARGLPPSEGAGFADVLRDRLVKISDCAVVERERMADLLREQHLQNGGSVDPAVAVKIGRILNAGSVITGSLGKIGNERVASLTMLSVETGAAQQTEYFQWSDARDLERIIDRLAEPLCKGGGSR